MAQLQDLGYLYGAHFLPHDADHKRLGDFNKSTKQQLQDLMPGQTFWIVPRITELMAGINATRKHLKSAYFDTEGTKQGIARLQGYQKKFSQSENRYLDQPNKHNGCSEGADALRQWAQAKDCGLLDGMTQTSAYKEARAGDWRTN